MLVGKTQPMAEEIRVASYYGVFFLTIGTVMPFVAIWLDSLGITTNMIGLILAAPPLAIVLFNIVIGSWADRLSDWRSAIVICNVVVFLLTLGLLFWQTPWAILALWTASGLFMIASSPITDAAALDMTERRGSDYAKVRAFGSVGFIIGIFCAGQLFEYLGMSAFAWVLLLGAVARVLAAYALPHFRDRIGQSDNSKRSDAKPTLFAGLVDGMQLFKKPGIFSVIFGAVLINASHSFNNTYAVLHWTQTGITTSTASILWTIAVAAEVALMWGFSSFAKKISARHCLLIAGATCSIRWLITGTDPSLVILVFLQCLHAITFGLTFLASVNFIARRVHPGHAAQAQSVLTTLTTLMMAIGTWLSGQFYERLAGFSYWGMAIMAMLGALFVLNSYRTQLQDVSQSPTPLANR